MNPTEALNALAAHFANTSDATVAQPLIEALRAMAARNPAGPMAPRAVINLTADRPRPVVENLSAAAFRSQIAQTQRELRKTIDAGNQAERAASLGSRLASLQQRLAERIALEDERPELAEAEPATAEPTQPRSVITIDPTMSTADLRQRLAVVSRAWTDAMERTRYEPSAYDDAARLATERNLLNDALVERSHAELSPLAAMPIKQLYERMTFLRSTIETAMRSGNTQGIEVLSQELMEVSDMLAQREAEVRDATAAAAAVPIM